MHLDGNKKLLLAIALLCIFFLAIGIGGTVLSAHFKLPGVRAWLHFGIAAIAIVMFFGLAAIEKPTQSTPWSLRRPLAATIVVVYLILVVTFSFYLVKDDLPPITDMLLTNFTAVVGVVIAFYFGSSAYVEGKKKNIPSEIINKQAGNEK